MQSEAAATVGVKVLDRLIWTGITVGGFWLIHKAMFYEGYAYQNRYYDLKRKHRELKAKYELATRASRSSGNM